jgi:hypothetical protein
MSDSLGSVVKQSAAQYNTTFPALGQSLYTQEGISPSAPLEQHESPPFLSFPTNRLTLFNTELVVNNLENQTTRSDGRWQVIEV